MLRFSKRKVWIPPPPDLQTNPCQCNVKRSFNFTRVRLLVCVHRLTLPVINTTSNGVSHFITLKWLLHWPVRLHPLSVRVCAYVCIFYKLQCPCHSMHSSAQACGNRFSPFPSVYDKLPKLAWDTCAAQYPRRWSLHLYQSYSTLCIFFLLKSLSALLQNHLLQVAVWFTPWPWWPCVCVIIHSLCSPSPSSLHFLHRSRAYQYSSRIRGRRFIVLFPMREKDAVPSSLPSHEKPIPHPAVLYGCTHSLAVSLSDSGKLKETKAGHSISMFWGLTPFCGAPNGEGVSCTSNLTDPAHPVVFTTALYTRAEARWRNWMRHERGHDCPS